MSESKIIYAIIPPEEEKGLILTGKGFFSMRAISKNLPKYSTVICGDSQKEINMQMALEIEPSVYLKIFGDLEINEFRALNSIEILENKTLLITTRSFLAALGFRNIKNKTMLVKISIDNPVEGLDSIEEII